MRVLWQTRPHKRPSPGICGNVIHAKLAGPSMAKKRRSISVDVRRLVLHEAGYKCANPVCRTILTLDVHHLVPVAQDGGDTPENLLALCPNCHALHHKGEIPGESIRAWKMLLLALNEAYDRKSVDLLLALDKCGPVWTSGDGLVDYASLVAADLVEFRQLGTASQQNWHPPSHVSLTEKGRAFVDGWKRGDQQGAMLLNPSS